MKRFLKLQAGWSIACGFTMLAALIPAMSNAQPVPVISSFSPMSGAVGAGINISGTNFSPTVSSNIVFFGAVQATVSSASSTNLLVAVPSGATYAPITVTVSGLTAWATQAFLPTYSGNGQFDASSLAPRLDLAADGSPGQVVIVDMDGDGRPDLVILNGDGASVSIFRNISTNGSLTANSFAPRVDLPLNASMSGSGGGMTVADLDGDGRPDIILAFAGASKVSILQNFCSPGNIASNTFGAQVDLPVNGGPVSVAVRDVDGDGRPEIATANIASNTVSILRNLGTGGMITTNSFARQLDFAANAGARCVSFADLDGDGKPDLVSVNYNDSSGTMSVLQNNCAPGTISFAAKVDFACLPDCNDVRACDLDGDGKPDLVVAEGAYGQAISVFRNLGTAGGITTNSFAPRVDFAVGAWAHTLAFADLDGDGKPDLAVACELPSQLSIFKNTSSPGSFTANSFAPRVDFATGWNAWGVALGDLAGDGRPDVVFANQYDNTVSIYQNIVPFAAPPSITSPPTNQTVTADGTATFGVVAAGTSPLNYQWSFNGTNLSGATNVSLILTNVQLSQAGNYAVLVTNAYGSVLSSNAVLTVTPLVACTPAPAGLVGWWKGDGNGRDSTGTNDATVPPGVTFVPAEVEQGFSFDGGANVMVVPDAPALNFSSNQDFSIELWLQPLANPGNWQDVMSVIDKRVAPDTITQLGYSINLQSGVVVFQMADVLAPYSWNNFSAGPDLRDGLFHHVAVTVQRNSTTGGQLYIDGQVVLTFDPTVCPGDLSNPGPFRIGNHATPGLLAFYHGIIDEVSLYNRALAPADIAAIYNAGSAGKCTSTLPAVPVISSFVPASGTIGTVVTISGSNFSATAAANIVYFGAVRATVLSASPASLTVAVPSGATFNPITVTVDGLTAYAPQPFLPTFSGAGQDISAASFGPNQNLAAGNGPVKVVIADMDGDGKPDLVVADTFDHTIYIYQNISAGGLLTAASFAAPVVLATPTGSQSPYYVQVADLDGDGKLDIIASDYGDNLISIFRNVSTPGNLTPNSFAARMDLATGATPIGVAIRDLDGDGRPEIVTANSGDNTISIFQNISTIGNIAFAPRIDLATGGGPQSVAIGDLDGDGKPDLAVADTSGFISLFRNNCTPGNISSNTFDARVDLPAQSDSLEVVIGDLDGDGKPELITSAYLPQTMSVYRNQSTPGSLTANSFAAPVDYGLAGRGHSIALTDINGDGKPDIAEVTELSSALSLFQNSGTGSFNLTSLASRVDFATGWNAWGLAVGDLDGDGRPDVVFANSYDNTLTIYQNQMPFGAAPVITMQPTNQSVALGGTASFSAVASGAQPLIYQWNCNGTNISGATNFTLTLTNVQLDQAGSYVLLVTNNFGSAASSNAVLSVFVPPIPPTILAQTPNQVVLLGNTATFSVTAGGSEPLSYFWQRNGALIPGATNSSYALNNAQLSDSGSRFSCLVTNAFGSAASTNVSLKVIDSTIANDLCSGAIVITGATYTNVQSTVQATSFGDPVPDCVDGFGHGVWYQFTAPVAGLLIVDTFGSDFDTGLAVYTGSCDALTEVACNDDTGGVTSQVILPTAAGVTYYILAGGYASDAGNLVLHLNHLTPPAFAVQPTNESVVVSSNASFTTTVIGTQPIGFQWYFNNTPLVDGGRISGSTNATLNIATIQTNDAGNYQLVASNIVGVVTSSVAVLTPIILPPVITQQPMDQSVLIGSNVTFTATVDGTPPYSYQWSFNGSTLTDDGLHISGSATSSLSISNLTPADEGSYMLTVTNVSGATNSTAATLTVLVPPAITTQPIGRSVPPGLPTTFNAAASGNPAPCYQWQLNGTNISGATGSSYTATGVGTNDLGFYHLVASNSVGVAVSTDAQLTFGPVAAWGLNSSGECLPPPGLSNVMAVAGNRGASFAVRTDGTVIPWGSGTLTNIPASASNVVAMATADAGGNYALRADGTIVGWPFLTPTLTNIISIANGYGFSYALRAEGTLTNFNGKGIVLPPGLNHITAVACGYNSALALRSDGTVVIAGTDGITNPPAGLNNVVAIAAGYSYAMALKSNGTVVAWGSGTGTNLPAGLTNIVAISAGNYIFENSGMAIRSDGTLLTWGDNNYGDKTPPTALSNLVSIAASAPAFHGLALVNNGSPVILQPPVGLTAYTGRSVMLQASAAGAQPLSYQWLLNGTNLPGATGTSLVLSNVQYGNAGNYQLFVSNSVSTALSLPAPLNVISNNALAFLSVPAGQTNDQGGKVSLGVTVLGNGPLRYQWFFSVTNKNYAAIAGATNDMLVLDPALAINTGYYSVAVSNQVSVITNPPVFLRVLFAKAWGYLPTDPPFNVTNATAIAVGNLGQGSLSGHYLVLKSDGTIAGWSGGFVSYGETNFSALSNSIVTAIAAGYGDSLALKSDGTVFAVGYNGYGETNVPAGLNSVTAIACGDYHDLALKSDGTVVGWGQNTYLQTTNAAATNVVAIAAGGQDSIALRADGSVVTWGFYGGGQFPVPSNATNIVAVAAGGSHYLALRANGTVVGWGNNTYGQTTIPANWTNIVAIAAAANHSVALRNDGTILTLGNYYNGPTLTPGSVPSYLANVVAIASGGDHDLALFSTRAPGFTVQPWDRSIPFAATTNITLAAKCAGVQPVYYQWQLNGANVSAATNDTLTLGGRNLSGAPIPVASGVYQLIASNAYGVVASKYAKITTFIPLGDALNTPTDGKGNYLYNWTTSGNAQWFGETNITHDGVSAAQSGGIGPLQETILQTTVGTNWSGRYTFWWKVSSEQDFDILEFRINGIVQTNISSQVDWQQVSIPVAAGTNVLMWRYSKDATIDSGQDAGWVDQFAFVPDGPMITLQPLSQTVNAGANITLRVIATPRVRGVLAYQWWKDGVLYGGFGGSALNLYNVGRAQNGSYSVTVTDVINGGSTVSSNAMLKVLVPQLLGTPTLSSDGTLRFTSTDADGGLLSPSDLANFEAQASTNLVDWVTLPNVLSLTNGMLELQDNSGTNWPVRFYRLLEH